MITEIKIPEKAKASKMATDEILMFLFSCLFGVFIFGFPLVTEIPKEKELYLSVMQSLTVFITVLSGLNALPDIKKLGE